MKHSEVRHPAYLDCFAAQLGTLGVAGQRRLQRAAVLIAGAGGLGAAISSTLATVGVGTLVIVDPQRMELENLNRYPFARLADIGKPKVDVLAAFFEGRPHLTAVPVLGTAEAVAKTRIARQNIQLLVSASNTVSSRLAVAQLASRYGVPHISAAVSDCRERRGGTVVAWIPERRDLACPACFLTSRARPIRGESLLATVVSTVGAMAACVAVQLLTLRDRTQALEHGNCLTIDLQHYAVEPIRVLRRHDCVVCAGGRGAVKARRHSR
ncbi:MAG TPA: ThiF family adenylyltransferase [Vicinamibacterales bacterium]|nr:ThiF family adenylyltransferase [Vicinamibacterales bacterium]